MQQVRIYRPAKNAMQSGRGQGKWVLEFEPTGPKVIEPLMGWIGGCDTRGQVRLRFETKEEAVAYAEREGLEFVVQDPPLKRGFTPKSYADNFKYDRVRG